MGYRKLPVKLVCTLSVIALLAGVSACRTNSRDLPVCPGDPRCDSR